jgi:hypothetical protein
MGIFSLAMHLIGLFFCIAALLLLNSDPKDENFFSLFLTTYFFLSTLAIIVCNALILVSFWLTSQYLMGVYRDSILMIQEAYDSETVEMFAVINKIWSEDNNNISSNDKNQRKDRNDSRDD